MRSRHALLCGLVQGPTEVLPISSSAHTALLLGIAREAEVRRDAELHNSLEVALHAGAAAALLIVLREELAQGLRELDRVSLLATTLALAPPALAGYLMEQRLERRASAGGSRRLLAAGLALGGAALAWADARPGTRRLANVRPSDGLALGVAQALALLPGVSRNGATLTAARARGFAREDAHTLSWRVGLPVLAGAATLKARRLARGDAPPGSAPALVVGAGAAFLSTMACAPALVRTARGRALWPFALYRAVVALLVASRSSGSA